MKISILLILCAGLFILVVIGQTNACISEGSPCHRDSECCQRLKCKCENGRQCCKNLKCTLGSERDLKLCQFMTGCQEVRGGGECLTDSECCNNHRCNRTTKKCERR
ncbi:uncharacterized protein LOC127288417 [Leptopilina boulardi]|uniref:uncharacterized protein LOC127288417 n=1 Tax=Leptopilina boulardi TaxID=63433 RepID=UPI0021F59950|nr:uncharacterized protein LOC127288417 [Leptopilina boulardi]